MLIISVVVSVPNVLKIHNFKIWTLKTYCVIYKHVKVLWYWFWYLVSAVWDQYLVSADTENVVSGIQDQYGNQNLISVHPYLPLRVIERTLKTDQLKNLSNLLQLLDSDSMLDSCFSCPWPHCSDFFLSIGHQVVLEGCKAPSPIQQLIYALDVYSNAINNMSINIQSCPLNFRSVEIFPFYHFQGCTKSIAIVIGQVRAHQGDHHLLAA